MGIGSYVHFLANFQTEADYRDYLLAADIGIQLRLVGMGSISGAVADCISVGLPTVSNDDLAEALDAPAYVERVPDRVSPVLIAEAIANQLDNGARDRPNEQARLAYHDKYNFRIYSKLLCQSLALDVA